MATEKFDYSRSSRVIQRSLNKLISEITAGVSKPSTFENVNNVRVIQDELSSEYDKFRAVIDQGFDQINPADAAAEQKKTEDAILSDLETVGESVRAALSKARSYISEYEGNRNRDSYSRVSRSFCETTADSGVKLPKIDIPPFDGKPEDFLDFAGIFENLVHDEPSIPKVKKLFYLKKALTGEPFEIIKNLPLSESGYDQAWGLILKTYKDFKSIIRRHFDSLFSVARTKSVKDIPVLLANVNKALKGLEACGEDVKNWSSMLSYIVSEKLDDDTFEDFEKTLSTNTVFPTWESLQKFLETRSTITKRHAKSQSSKRPTQLVGVTVDSKSNHHSKCAICSQSHLLIHCSEFLSKSPRQRFELIKSKLICRNCFKSNHKTSDCTKAPNCQKCKLPHHTLLHFDEESAAVSESKTCNVVTVPVNPSKAGSSLTCMLAQLRASGAPMPTALLPTAVVKFKSGDKRGEIRVLLDSCSQVNLITKSFLKRMHLSSFEGPPGEIRGVSGSVIETARLISLKIKSRTEPFSFTTAFQVVDQSFGYSVLDAPIGVYTKGVCFENYPLADPVFYSSTVSIQDVDALMGIYEYNRVVRGEVVQIGDLCLRNTKFGWTVTTISRYMGEQCAQIKRPSRKAQRRLDQARSEFDPSWCDDD